MSNARIFEIFNEKAVGIKRPMVGITREELLEQRRLRLEYAGAVKKAYSNHADAITIATKLLKEVGDEATANDLVVAINRFDINSGIHYEGNTDFSLILEGVVEKKKLQQDSRYLVYKELVKEQKRLLDAYDLAYFDADLNIREFKGSRAGGSVVLEAHVGNDEEGKPYPLTEARRDAIQRIKKIGELAAALDTEIRAAKPEPYSAAEKESLKGRLNKLRESMTSTGSWFGFLTRGKQLSSSGSNAIDNALWQVDHPGEKQPNAAERAVASIRKAFGRR